jgi:uncharacterized coiled-coil DUF342 family protein
MRTVKDMYEEACRDDHPEGIYFRFGMMQAAAYNALERIEAQDAELSRLRADLGDAHAAHSEAHAEIERLLEESRRYYNADGTFGLGESADEVIERRKAAAQELQELRIRNAKLNARCDKMAARLGSNVKQHELATRHYAELGDETLEEYHANGAELDRQAME